MGITSNHPESLSHAGRAVRIKCQLCGNFYYAIAAHVKGIHKSTITDLIIEGKWINERFPEY